MMKNIDADYYGYRDDDDGILIPLEKKRSEELEKEAREKWLNNKNSENAMETEENNFDAVPDEPMVCAFFLFAFFIPDLQKYEKSDILTSKKG